VFSALVLLLILVSMTPVIWLTDGATTYGAIAFVIALSLYMISRSVQPREVEHLKKVLPLPLLLMTVPGIWILIQLAPMPFGYFSHPVWTSAADALGAPVAGHISIDVGATSIAFLRYLTTAGVLVGAATVSVDRAHADWLFICLIATTSVFAVILSAYFFNLLQVERDLLASLYSACSLGTIAAGGAIIRSVERYDTGRHKARIDRSRCLRSLAISSSSFALCWFALLASAPASIICSAGFGVATSAMVFLNRRLFLGPLVGGAFTLVTAAVGIAIVATAFTPGSGDFTFRFAEGISPSSMSMAEQMIIDNRTGTGAGTYEVLLPIYRFSNDNVVLDSAPTTALAITIEMGRVALWIFFILSLILLFRLFLGAVGRGRDSFYATAAVGCAVTLIAESFLDTTLFRSEIAVLAMSILGLGITQSKGRSAS
jgi:hypothetical protein